MPKPPTAHAIDEACRLGHFVYFGNRQKILGAVSHLREQGEAAEGCVWIHRASDKEWQQVKLSEVVIERKENHEMLKGKRGPRPSARSSKKKSQARSNNDNQELPGLEVDQRRIAAIERAQEKKEEASKALSVAHEEFDEADKRLVKAMEANGFDAETNPVYTRQPWGSVVLQQKGEIKVTAKFTAGVKKAKKKKIEEEESIDSGSDENSESTDGGSSDEE